MTTAHNLDFEVAPWTPLPGLPPSNQFKRFRVGTCHGLWGSSDACYDILAIHNDEKGNGHFEDVLQWFYGSCLRDKKGLRFLEIMNPGFKKHLLKKRGYAEQGLDNVWITYEKILETNK